MIVTLEHLKAGCPLANRGKLAAAVEPLNAAAEEFGIVLASHLTEWLAQIAQETAGWYYVEEIASGAAYDSRGDLGNLKPEAIEVARRNGTTAGRWFKGHGWIQTTGYDNHVEVRDKLGIDCVENPKLLCEPVNAARSAGLFWQLRDLNKLAEAGDTRAITKVVNGAATDHAPSHYLNRLAYKQRFAVALIEP